jgi:hypothetical protein
MPKLNRPWRDVAVFLLLGGAASLAMGIDNNWDLRNYHFYNPWAWLNGRMAFDYAPAQLQSYYSPFLDLPFYALVRAGIPAIVICFLMGVPFGLAAYFFVRIANIAVGELGISHEKGTMAAVVVVGLTGAAGVSQIGSTMNEWATAAIVLGALFVLLRANQSAGRLTVGAGASAGSLLGMAVGLKLTAGVFAGAAFIALVAWWWTKRANLRTMIAFSAGGLVGFAIAYGYWGSVLWSHFHNPFFPYFNGIFRSPYWEPTGLLDRRLIPDSFAHAILLPFRLVRRNHLVTEEELRDLRLALLCVAAAALAILRVARLPVARKQSHDSESSRAPGSVLLLATFVFAAYVMWLGMFSIYRYTIPIEVIAGLLLVLAVRECLRGIKHPQALVVAFALGVVVTTVAPNWGRVPLHRGSYFDVAVPSMPANALVVVLSNDPIGYLVPFMPRGARVIRPVSNFTDPAQSNRLEREMAGLIASHDGPMFDLRLPTAPDPREEPALRIYGLEREDAGCEEVRSNLQVRPVAICPLRRR